MIYICITFAGVEVWPHWPAENRETLIKCVRICSQKC